MSIKNKELIQEINKAFAEGDTGFFLNALADDARWTIITTSTVIGKENISTAMETKEFQSLPEITVKNIVAEGDIVLVQSAGKAIGKSGQPYDAAYCDVYRLQNGKIKEFTTYVVETTY